MKICSSCHSLIEDDAVTCPNCGAEQRHFPEKTSKERKKPTHPALKLIVPAVLVLALMGGVLALALRLSDSPPQTTEATTTPPPIILKNPNPRVVETGSIVCENGEGGYSYDAEAGRLELSGTGVLSFDLSGNDHLPWQEYLQDTTELVVEGFSEIAPETFRGAPNLEVVTVTTLYSDMYIGEYAFADCPTLVWVKLGEMHRVDLHGFWDVQLGEGCFSGCASLISVNAEGVSEIGANVFDGLPEQVFFLASDLLERVDSLPVIAYVSISFETGCTIKRSVLDKLLAGEPDLLVYVDGSSQGDRISPDMIEEDTLLYE